MFSTVCYLKRYHQLIESALIVHRWNRFHATSGSCRILRNVFFTVAIWMKGIEMLKRSFMLANQTTRTLVTIIDPRLPWSLDRWIDRQIDRWIDRQIDRQMDRFQTPRRCTVETISSKGSQLHLIYRQIERQKDR